MPIALVIILLLGGGTSAAAETSLPGDLLYTVKINVNENIRSMLAVSAESQARWDTRRVEKRVEEAEKLAEENRLDEKNTLELQANLDAHVKDLENNVAKLSDKKDFNAAADVNSDFGASLDAHQEILVRLEERNSDLAAKLRPILLKVRAYSDSAEKSRIEVESKISASGSAEVQTAAEGKMKAAQNKIDEVAKFLEQKKSSVTADVYASASTKLESAKKMMIEGNAYISNKDYASAFSSFQKASRGAQESKSIITANLKLDIGTGVDIKDNDEEEKNESEEKEGKRATSSVEIRGDAGVRSDGQKTETEGSVKIKIGL